MRAPDGTVRPMGSFELYFEAAYDLLGAYNVAATYTLSHPTTLPALKSAARTLRLRHRMLQVDARLAWRRHTGHYVQADHLAERVEHHTHPVLPVHELAQRLMDGPFAEHHPDRTRRQWRRDRRSAHLPWALVLSPDGSHVIFLATHGICDGMSLDILGGDLVLALNNTAFTRPVVPIAPPIETLFGRVGPATRISLVFTLLHELFRKRELAGLRTAHLPRDWHVRTPLSTRIDLSLHDMSPFRARCREHAVSLNSGMVSAMYEALARTPAFATTGKQLEVAVDMDARRRVPEGSPLTGDNVGVYVGVCAVKEDGTAGLWSERAKSVQRKVHSIDVRNAFIPDAMLGGFAVKTGKGTITSFASNKEFGRLYLAVFSNVGQATHINEANEQCTRGAQDGGDNEPILIEKMCFDDSQLALGAWISCTVSTVGQNLSCVIASQEPLLSKDTFNTFASEFRAMLVK